MVTPRLTATVDQLSDAERRDLLHYLEQTIDDDCDPKWISHTVAERS